MVKTGFLAGRFCGSFAGIETKSNVKTGEVKSVVTFMTMKGKKYRFVVLGDVVGDFESVQPFAVIVVDLIDVEIGKPGEYGNYGDQNFTVSSLKLIDSNVSTKSAAQHPEKKSA